MKYVSSLKLLPMMQKNKRTALLVCLWKTNLVGSSCKFEKDWLGIKIPY